MRYFLEFAYNGTRYCGYQIQPDAPSIQASIEKALYTILRRPTPIVGCGRTDTGVHAKHYIAHFDSPIAPPDRLLYALNSLIGKDIVFYNLIPVHEEAHARFDANSRSYEYHIDLQRNPFAQETAYYCSYAKKLDFEMMQEAAALLLEYEEFETFCKTNTDAKTRRCILTRSEWVYDQKNQHLVYHVTANRFLRGMIRLIVGMCLTVGRGKEPLSKVKQALDEQKSLDFALSAPAHGLYLCDIRYPYLNPKSK